jgi:hypothetical protein
MEPESLFRTLPAELSTPSFPHLQFSIGVQLTNPAEGLDVYQKITFRDNDSSHPRDIILQFERCEHLLQTGIEGSFYINKPIYANPVKDEREAKKQRTSDKERGILCKGKITFLTPLEISDPEECKIWPHLAIVEDQALAKVLTTRVSPQTLVSCRQHYYAGKILVIKGTFTTTKHFRVLALTPMRSLASDGSPFFLEYVEVKETEKNYEFIRRVFSSQIEAEYFRALKEVVEAKEKTAINITLVGNRAWGVWLE